MSEFILKFNEANNFDPVGEKYGTLGDREDIARNVAWIINCAESAIEKAYGDGAPRRVEMFKMCNELRGQLRNQLSQEEIETLKLG